MKITTTRARLAVISAAALLALTGCATTAEAPATSSPSATSTAAAASTEASQVKLADAWVKAVDGGMSGAFGIFHNAGSAPVTLVSATTPDAGMVELHETVDSESGEKVMQEKQGGFSIPAGGEFELKPGENHIMLMGLKGPLVAGNLVEMTLTFADGSTIQVEAPVKDYAGANENYVGGDEHAGMDHGSSDAH